MPWPPCTSRVACHHACWRSGGLLRGVDDNLRLACKFETSVRAYRAARGFRLVGIHERLHFSIERCAAAAVRVVEPRAHRAQLRLHPRPLPPQPLAAGVVRRPAPRPGECIVRRIILKLLFNSKNEGLKCDTEAKAKASGSRSLYLKFASLYTPKRHSVSLSLSI